MKLVLLYFCVVLLLALFIIILLLFSTIKLNIANVRLSNIKNNTRKKLEKEFLIYFELYLFGKIKIVKIKLPQKMIEKLKLKNNMKNIERASKIIKKVNILEVLKTLKIKLNKINLYAQIGTEDVIFTVFVVTILSTIISIVARDCNYKNVKYKILPLYQFGNSINFRLNCIISVKMVHIIYVIYILSKKGMIRNERASNRRSYDYSYE